MLDRYKKGSGFSSTGTVNVADVSVNDVSRAPDTSVSNVDIAPTVCALLGISVPGAVTGTFIRPIVEAAGLTEAQLKRHWNDLCVVPQWRVGAAACVVVCALVDPVD